MLGIRGTTTLSDALTDAVGEATKALCRVLLRGLAREKRDCNVQVPECPGLLAHKAMLASALASPGRCFMVRVLGTLLPGQCTGRS